MRQFTLALAAIILSLPAIVVGYAYEFLARGFIVGREIADEHIDCD